MAGDKAIMSADIWGRIVQITEGFTIWSWLIVGAYLVTLGIVWVGTWYPWIKWLEKHRRRKL